MAHSPESEANYKAYQQQYHADRNARARYAYEALEKDNRITVKGKDLSAELMHTRAPGVTGETPWEKDLSIHPLKWRRQGMPKDLPRSVHNAFGDEAPGRLFIDPRMLFDCSLFDNMTDEEIEYFNDEKHWVVPGPEERDHITLNDELEGEPGVYGYLVHVNRGRKELNNPPAGRPRYKRKDGKILTWNDPRLDAPYWQECGDSMFTYLNEQEAREAFENQKLHLYDLNQEVRLYRLTKPINLGDARAWLNSDHPLREKEHGAITLDAFGTGQYETLVHSVCRSSLPLMRMSGIASLKKHTGTVSLPKSSSRSCTIRITTKSWRKNAGRLIRSVATLSNVSLSVSTSMNTSTSICRPL